VPDPAALEADPVALAVSDDVLNQILHAAWLAGAFDVEDLAAIVPLGDALPGARVALSSGLPPVVIPRRGDSPGVDIGWGELAFDLAFAGPSGAATVRGVLSLVVGLERLEADASGGLRPVFAPGAEVAVQVTHVDWDHLPTTRRLTEGLVAALVRNALPDLLGRVASIPLPALDLGALDPGLGPITLALDAPRVDRLGRYTVLAGGVASGP
jgi:hypothetical protein